MAYPFSTRVNPDPPYGEKLHPLGINRSLDEWRHKAVQGFSETWLRCARREH